MSNPTKAVILAAGRGVRMGALTENCPKPLLKVADKPILTWIIQSLEAAGVTEVCLVVEYLQQMIRDTYGSQIGGVKVSYQEQINIPGTGAAILSAEDFCDRPFLLTFGDILFFPPDHYKSVADSYGTPGVDAVLAANWVPDPCVGAAVYYDETGRVTHLVEKPPKGSSESNYNQAGCFAFGPDFLDLVRAQGLSVRGEMELTGAVNALIESGAHIQVHKVPQADWLDSGTPEDLSATDLALRARLGQK